MMKLEEKLTHLTTLLLEKTREGKIPWKPSATDDVFVSTFDKYGVSVRENILGGYELSLIDTTGTVIESIRETTKFQIEGGNLSELFTLARRSAHNVEESLDNLLQELESR